jgi:hypothetical protein
VIDLSMTSDTSLPRITPQPRSWAVLAAMVSLLILLVFKGWVTHPPSVMETKAATGFDGDRAVARLARILGDEIPHPVDSAANDVVRERLLAEITQLGYTPDVRDDQICRGAKRWGGMACARVRNVVFRIGPVGGNGVLVASHYDSVPAAPGAADDGAGVSAALEIASLLRNKPLTKPVIFLFSDGEEAGLLGATSFIKKDPYAKDVALAINMEARGTGGPAIMFQTSTPNSREITALTHGSVRTVANSLAADIYRLLPNDTDATLFLEKQYDVLNFAFISPLARYHTSEDKLANLETASVSHMGAAALAAIMGHMAATMTAQPETQLIYSDVLGRIMLVLPSILGWVLLGLAFVAAGFAFVRAEKGGSLRALAAPLVSILAASGLGFGLLALVDAVRLEEVWWSVHPEFARGLIYGASVVGAGFGLWLCRGIAHQRVVAGAWLWVSGVFLGLAFVAPGSMILVAPAAGIYAVSVVIGQVSKRAYWPNALWIAVLILLIFPTLDFAEAGLGFDMGWALGGLAGLISFAVLSGFVSAHWVSWKPVVSILGLSLIATLAACFVPAYSPKVPRPLNVGHVHEGADNHWLLSPGTEPAPTSIQTITPFAVGRLASRDYDELIAKAPPQATSPQSPRVEIVSEVATGTTRTLVLRIVSPEVDEVVLNAPIKAGVVSIGTGNALSEDMIAFEPNTPKGLRCVGRACAIWEIKVVLAATKSDWTLSTVRRGQGPEGQPLVKARPAWAAPIQGGDRRVSVRVQGV